MIRQLIKKSGLELSPGSSLTNVRVDSAFVKTRPGLRAEPSENVEVLSESLGEL